MTTETRADGWALVAAAQGGDTDAFGELWRRYRFQVGCYIASCVNNRAVAEDLTSETFLRAFRRIETVHNQGKDVGAWFIAVARNLVLDHMKSSHFRRSNSYADVTIAGQVPLIDGPEVTVPQQRCEDDAAQRLQFMVHGLSPYQRAVIEHRFFDRRSIAQTAALMGLSDAAVKSTQHRAVVALAGRSGARTSVEFIDGVRA